MNKYLSLILIPLLTACTIQYEPADEHPMDSILIQLRSRKSWTTKEVKMDLRHPYIQFNYMTVSSIPLDVEVWGSNQNDYNVPMIRINSQDRLGELTEKEFDQLSGLYKKNSNQGMDPTR